MPWLFRPQLAKERVDVSLVRINVIIFDQDEIAEMRAMVASTTNPSRVFF
jgi:hypothetical protein